MPISKKFRAFEIEGRRVRTDVRLRRGDGEELAAGAVLTIVSARHNLELHSDTCPQCGQSFHIYGVSRKLVTLLPVGSSEQYRAHSVAVRREELKDLVFRLRTSTCSTLSEHKKHSEILANEIESMLDRQDLEDTSSQEESLEVKRVRCALAEMRSDLDEIACNVDSETSERVVQSGWHLFDLVMDLIDTKQSKKVAV